MFWRSSIPAFAESSVLLPACSQDQMKGAKAKPASDSKDLSNKPEETNFKKRKQLAVKDDKPKKKQASKGGKAKKDPNKPKRPPTAFFVFLEEFRKTFTADNPTVKAVSAVGKAGGAKWKAMSDADKATYVAKAAKKKMEYQKTIEAYNSNQSKPEEDVEAEESDKSKSEMNDEDEEESDEGEED